MGTIFKKFSTQSIAATRAAWLAAAEQLGMPSIDYEMVLDWADNHINYSSANGDSYAYGIFPDESDEALAIIDLVYTQRGGQDRGWLKMLSVKLAPEFAPSQLETNAEKFLQLLNIYADATVGTIALTDHHPARVVKLYGRNEKLLGLLFALNERLTAKMADKFSTRMEGRWLVISAL